MTGDGGELQHLLEKVYRERGFDFREYKETTLTRRLGRRLRARGAQTYADYARVLDQDPAEYEKLFDYFTPTLQTRVLKGFHEGLREGGFLLLGKAEVPMGETRGLLQCVEQSAPYFAMPRAAIEADAVDYVLPLGEIAGKIAELLIKR